MICLFRFSDQELLKRESDPLKDQIDIPIVVLRVPFEKLNDKRTPEPTAKVQERIEAIRAV